MARQDEIKEGVGWEIQKHYGGERDCMVVAKVLNYLNSQGVVIMVGGNYDVAQVEPLI